MIARPKESGLLVNISRKHPYNNNNNICFYNTIVNAQFVMMKTSSCNILDISLEQKIHLELHDNGSTSK